MDAFWFREQEDLWDSRRARKLTLGNFFNPGNSAFLGGNVSPILPMVIGAGLGMGAGALMGGAAGVGEGLATSGAGDLMAEASTGMTYAGGMPAVVGAGTSYGAGDLLNEASTGMSYSGGMPLDAATAMGSLSSGWTSPVSTFGGDVTGVTSGSPMSFGGGGTSGGFGGDWWNQLKRALMPGQGSGLNLGMNALSSGYGLYNSAQMRKMAQQMNPNAPYLGGYAAQLNNLVNNPNSISSMPGYQFQYDQGLQALQRTGAAQGYTGSGNMALALQRYGQDYASQQYPNYVNMLSGLTQGGNPAALQGTQMANNLASQSLATLGYGANRGMQLGGGLYYNPMGQ